MKNIKSTLATTMILGVASWGVMQMGLAAPQTAPLQSLTPATHVKIIHVMPAHSMRMWRLGFHHNKNLNAQDAATVTKAALIMRGKHNLNVGKVEMKQTKHGHKLYLVNIVNAKHNVIKQVMVSARSGMIRPLHLHAV